MKQFGWIGTGNMGFALAKGVCRKVGAQQIVLTDKCTEKATEAAAKLSCRAATVGEVAATADFIFLGVKPQILDALAAEIAPILRERTDRFVVVSMLAGTSIERVESAFGMEMPVIRIMPNVACLVGEGMTLCAANNAVSEAETEIFLSAMSGTGKMDRIAEKGIDAASAISGCGPAYAYLMIEALADGAVDCGVPREKAYLYAAQMLSGSAQLMLETGKHPADLKDSVCSPGGTTIEGVRALENGGFRAAVMEAVKAAYDRTLELGKK